MTPQLHLVIITLVISCHHFWCIILLQLPKLYKCLTLLMYILDIFNDVMILGLLLVHVYMTNANMVHSHPLSV